MITKVDVNGNVTQVPPPPFYINPPVPALMAFETNSEGLKLGKPQMWTGKAYRVTDQTGRGYTVMPHEIIMAV